MPSKPFKPRRRGQGLEGQAMDIIHEYDPHHIWQWSWRRMFLGTLGEVSWFDYLKCRYICSSSWIKVRVLYKSLLHAVDISATLLMPRCWCQCRCRWPSGVRVRGINQRQQMGGINRRQVCLKILDKNCNGSFHFQQRQPTILLWITTAFTVSQSCQPINGFVFNF